MSKSSFKGSIFSFLLIKYNKMPSVNHYTKVGNGSGLRLCEFCSCFAWPCLHNSRKLGPTLMASPVQHNKSRYSPSMVGWTKVGREIQPLSSPCPSNAQCLSKGGSATRSVQSLSNSCQIPVQSNTTWTDIGHKTPCSSTLLLSETTIYNLGQSLDKLATWTMC